MSPRPLRLVYIPADGSEELHVWCLQYHFRSDVEATHASEAARDAVVASGIDASVIRWTRNGGGPSVAIVATVAASDDVKRYLAATCAEGTTGPITRIALLRIAIDHEERRVFGDDAD